MSIQEHLDKIRNAIYGREVRESIAKGIETAYNDASEKDNANMEVKIARGTHPNLRSRLEEVDNKQRQTTAQLAHKLTKGEVSVSDIDKNKGKFDQTYMSDEFLQQMAGDTPINAVPADGSITTPKIAKKAVTYNETDFLSFSGTGKNRFNPSNVTKGQWLTDEGGLEASYQESYDTTDFFKVEYGERLFVSAESTTHALNRKIAFYDENMSFLSLTEHFSVSHGATVPSGAVYARISFSEDAVKFQIEAGSGVSSYEPYVEFSDLDYDKIRLDLDKIVPEKSITTLKIDDGAVSKNKTDFIVKKSSTINQFDKNAEGIIRDVLMDTDGSLSGNPVYYLTDYIEVRKGDVLLISNLFSQGSNPVRAYALYDKDGKAVKTVSQTSGIGIQLFNFPNDERIGFTLAIDVDCHYIKLNLRTDRMNETMVEIRNNKYVPRKIDYVPFVPVYQFVRDIEFSVEELNYWNNKKVVFNGDSITAEYIPYSGEHAIGYNRFVAEALGMSFSNFAIGGSSLAVKEDDPETRNPLVTRYQEMDDDADLVIIAIGTNDWNYTQTPVGNFSDRTNYTFYGALHNLCLGLIEKYSGKQLLFLTPIKRMQDNGPKFYETNSNGKTLREYCDIIKEVCEFYSIPVIDMFAESGINPHILAERSLYVPDGVHPNTAGHRIMARRIVGYLKQLA